MDSLLFSFKVKFKFFSLSLLCNSYVDFFFVCRIRSFVYYLYNFPFFYFLLFLLCSLLSRTLLVTQLFFTKKKINQNIILHKLYTHLDNEHELLKPYANRIHTHTHIQNIINSNFRNQKTKQKYLSSTDEPIHRN